MRNSEPDISQNYHYWRDRLPGYSFPEWECYSGSRWYLKSTSRPAKIPKQTIQRLSTTHQFKLKLQKTLQPPSPTNPNPNPNKPPTPQLPSPPKPPSRGHAAMPYLAASVPTALPPWPASSTCWGCEKRSSAARTRQATRRTRTENEGV